MPATSPAASQERVVRSRSARATRTSSATHTTWSTTVVPNSRDAPTNAGQAAIAAAVRVCARRPPPNSAVSIGASSRQPTCPATARIRSGSTPPGSAAANRARTGVSGGWSA